ncbi:putative Rho-associated protein kinase [Acephala macrosclerotiorum]|nr:putative Rho-associated protein kinase [Acephala macrosclerotiorum]
MAGLSWTYEYLCEVIPQFTRYSSSPIDASDLNPIIKRLLAICPGSSIFGIGGNSVLLSITEDIAAKVSLKPDGPHLRHEQAIFGLLDRAQCLHIIQVFLCCPDITFMQLLKNGTLHQRMTMVNKPRPILQWMQQLSIAAACLEGLGYVHGDINPRNILLDDRDQVKLGDFDHTLKIGEDLDVGYEPYVRAQRLGAMGGTYGIAGPITEQFALGSVFWYITRGTELYADLEGPDQVDRLIDGRFPATDPQDPIDNIISNCWLGKYQSIAALSKHIQETLDLSKHNPEVATLKKTYREKKKICAQYYELVKDSSC